MNFLLGKNLVFIVSMQFMNSSLEYLVIILPKNKFNYLSQEFSKKQLELVKQKRHYSDEYMNSFERFDKIELSKKEDFYIILNDKHISDKDYKYPLKIWNKFYMKTSIKCHNLYLKTCFFVSRWF